MVSMGGAVSGIIFLITGALSAVVYRSLSKSYKGGGQK